MAARGLRMTNRRDARAPEYKEADRPGQARPPMPEVRARQGVTGHNARYVLGFGIATVVIAFFIIYMLYFA